jgi:hypothetical protein
MTEQEDFLEVDKPIPGQNYICLSFISPESIIKDKDIFVMRHFLNDIRKNEIINKSTTDISEGDFSDLFDNFKFNNLKQLNDQFDEENEFKTSVRAVKIRGTYDTIREANIRAKVLQRKDPNFHVFVGQMGYWLPWDPNAEDIKDQEYQEGELNELMCKYKENVQSRDDLYEKDKQAKQKKILEENRKRRAENDRIKKEQTDQENPDQENPDQETTVASGVPTHTPEETMDNINAFREILNEKERLLENMTKGKSQSSTEIEDITTEETTGEGGKGVEETTGEGGEGVEETKGEGVKESKSEFEEVNLEIEESNKNLKTIIDDIF